MNKTDLLKRIDSFLVELERNPKVSLYHRYLNSIHEQKIDLLLRQSDDLKREAKRQPYMLRKEMLLEAKCLYDRYQDHPLVQNAKSIRQEILDSLRPLNFEGGL